MTLPGGWSVASLEEVCHKPQYGWTTKSSPTGDTLKILRITDIQDGRVNWSTVPHCEEEPDDRAKFMLKPDDVVVARSGATVGKSLRLRHPEPAVFASYLIRIRTTERVLPGYLAWFMQAPLYWEQITEAKAGVAQPNVNASKLAALSIPVPPVDEQRRIVDAIETHLSHLDAGVESLQRAKRNIERMRAALFEKAISGELSGTAGDVGPQVSVAAGSEESGLPPGWVHVSTGEICEVQGGIQKQPKRSPSDNPYPYLRVANVLRNALDLDEIHEFELFEGEIEKFHLEPGDLLVVEGNGSRNQIGRSALWHGEIEDCVHQNHIIRVRPGDRISPEYLNLYWNAPSTSKVLADVASSTSGLYTLSMTKVKAVPVKLPPRDQQGRIVAEVERQTSLLDSLHTEVERGLARASRLRAAILAAAFRGGLATGTVAAA